MWQLGKEPEEDGKTNPSTNPITWRKHLSPFKKYCLGRDEKPCEIRLSTIGTMELYNISKLIPHWTLNLREDASGLTTIKFISPHIISK